MNVPHFSRRLTKRAYRASRFLVRMMMVLAVLGIVAFIFLRIYGIPDPLLRAVVRRVNAAGVPVEVEGITLTLHGWRADRVRYYSANPDDLAPLFEFDQVFFSARDINPEEMAASGRALSIKAVGVGINPSVEWGVSIPPESPSRRVDQIALSLRFLPDRIVVSKGEIDWLGSQFNVSGAILKGIEKGRVEPKPPIRRQKTLSPVYITEQQFQAFETRLKNLSLPHGAVVDLGFSIDMTDYSKSWVELSAYADDLKIQNLEFSRLEMKGSYLYPTIKLDHVTLFQDEQSVELAGKYNLASKEVEGALKNSITSNQLLLLLPEGFSAGLSRAGLRIDHLPRLALDFGPSLATNLLNHLSGRFAIQDVAYQGLELQEVRGQVKRFNDRLEFSELFGAVQGQEEQAEEMESAMQGGFAEGTVFWDGNTREFGIDVDARLDPNLLVQALAPISIATNIIRRFRFENLPPQGHVSVGMRLEELDSFYIDIQASGNDVRIEGVDFSSVEITQTYRQGKLTLDPIDGRQGEAFINGSLLLDFHQTTAAFDIHSSMNPADLEDLVVPRLNLFDNYLTVEGDSMVDAHGTFDWGSMRQTDFTANVEVEHLGLGVTELDQFSAEVVGDGSLITVTNGLFNLFGGNGTGNFSVLWKPSEKALPYDLDTTFSQVDFRKFLHFFNEDRSVSLSGNLMGNLHVSADFSTHFFAVAEGHGSIRVEDGQLADLPLFNGFSRLMRKMFPSFTVFSITSLWGDFKIGDGVVSSQEASFDGDLLSAKGRGSYSPATGFDAYVQAQVLSEGKIAKVVRVITNPLMKLFEMKLTGTLADPAWELEKF